MASNISRLILMKSAATPRWFSTATATATATKGKRASLFQKLSDLETTEGDVAEALDQWVAEGKTVKSSNVLSCVNRLLKDEKYKRAAQVCEWMEKSRNNSNEADHAGLTDLPAKTKGAAAQVQNSTLCEGMENSKKNLKNDLNRRRHLESLAKNLKNDLNQRRRNHEVVRKEIVFNEKAANDEIAKIARSLPSRIQTLIRMFR